MERKRTLSRSGATMSTMGVFDGTETELVIRHHLNLHGEYDFSEEKLQDSVGFELPKILVVDVS